VDDAVTFQSVYGFGGSLSKHSQFFGSSYSEYFISQADAAALTLNNLKVRLFFMFAYTF
jgi:hypothetical protein